MILEKITAAFKASKARALALERDLHRHKALLTASGVTVAGYTLEQQQQNQHRQQQLQLQLQQQQQQQQEQERQQGLTLPRVKGATEERAATPTTSSSAVIRAELRLPHAVILGPGDEHEFQREPGDRDVRDVLFAAQPSPTKPLPPRPPVQASIEPQAGPHSQGPWLAESEGERVEEGEGEREGEGVRSETPTDPVVSFAKGKGSTRGRGQGQAKGRSAARRDESAPMEAVGPAVEPVGPPAIHFGMLTATRDALRSSFMNTSVAASASSDAVWETQAHSHAHRDAQMGGGGNDDSSLWRSNRVGGGGGRAQPVRVALSTLGREKDEGSVSASVVMSSHATAMSSELQ